MNNLVIGVIDIPQLSARLRVPVTVQRTLPDGTPVTSTDAIQAVDITADQAITQLASQPGQPFPVFVGRSSWNRIDDLLGHTPAVFAVTDDATQTPPAGVTGLIQLPAALRDIIASLPTTPVIVDESVARTRVATNPDSTPNPEGGAGCAAPPTRQVHPTSADTANNNGMPHVTNLTDDEFATAIDRSTTVPAYIAPEPSTTTQGAPTPVQPPAPEPMPMVTPTPHQPTAAPLETQHPALAPLLTPTPAPVVTPAPHQPQPGYPQVATNYDMGDLFTPAPSFAISTPVATNTPRHGARILIVWAGKGGVGKTTTSASIAALATSNGLRTALVDSSIGQGDQRLNLGIPPRAAMPSILDAAITGHPEAALCTPDLINAMRPGRATQVNFALVPAPPVANATDPRITPAVYLAAVAHLRNRADLIIIDTQIIEASRQQMFEHFILPLLLDGAYSLGLTDGSLAGVSHLSDRLHDFADRGVTPARQMWLLNKIEADSPLSLDALSARLAPLATGLGVIGMDNDINRLTNAGELTIDNPTLRPYMELVLNRITGLGNSTPSTPQPHRRGLLSRIFGKAAK